MVLGKNWSLASLVLVSMISDLPVVMVLLHYCYISLQLELERRGKNITNQTGTPESLVLTVTFHPLKIDLGS